MQHNVFEVTYNLELESKLMKDTRVQTWMDFENTSSFFQTVVVESLTSVEPSIVWPKVWNLQSERNNILRN